LTSHRKEKPRAIPQAHSFLSNDRLAIHSVGLFPLPLSKGAAMNKWFFPRLVLALVALLASCSSGQAPEKSSSKGIEFHGHAVSMRVLIDRLKECDPLEPYPELLQSIAGLTKISGYIVDKERKDVVLIGEKDALLPPLHLDDLVVALRNAWMEYAELKGNTIWYSDPGCSIDPDTVVMAELQVLGDRIASNAYPGGLDRGIAEWFRIGQSPQSVRVMGVPFDSRFASVMVEADYDMKRLVDGSDSLGIQGFKSLTDLSLDEARKNLEAGGNSVELSSMNRFWFYPGKTTYTEGKDYARLETCPVTLLTEEEFVTRSGGISGRGKPNKFAKIFADSFTKHYAQIAYLKPIYSELSALFSHTALVKIMKEKEVFQRANLDNAYLLKNYKVTEIPVSRSLPGRCSVKGFEMREETPAGYRVTTIRMPSCGGVEINVSPQLSLVNSERAASMQRSCRQALSARPSAAALDWEF